MDLSLITPRRRVLCGCNVARDSYRGLIVALIIPVVVTTGINVVMLSDDFLDSYGAASLPWMITWILLLSLTAEVFCFLVLFADPGVLPPGEVTPVSHLCYVCLIEVEDFDHHCGVLGACIGKGNFAYFLCFLTSLAALCTTGVVLALQYCARIAQQSKLAERIVREWWFAIPAIVRVYSHSHVTFVAAAVLLICAHATVLTALMALHYWWLALRGRHAVNRRRRQYAGGGLRSLFVSFWKPRCTDPMIIRRYYDSLGTV